MKTFTVGICIRGMVCLAVIGGALHAAAQDIGRRIAEYSLPYNTAAGPVLQNPALLPWLHNASLGDIRAGFNGNPSRREGFFDARIYMPLKGSRNEFVEGHATYTNGLMQADGIVESDDYDRTGPYALADTICGPRHSETYSFGGTYARRAGRFTWGAGLSYLATLSYRKRDPRPRNTCGTLKLDAGAGWIIAGHALAASIGYERYRQSSSITFMSEMGQPMTYHLTGLGTAYNRFNSQGKNTHYTSDGYDAALDLMPVSSKGFFAHGNISGSRMQYVLKDLNSLPMSELSVRSTKLLAGYRNGNRSDMASGSISYSHSSRDGTENIFGDAVSDVYPMLTSLKMYTESSHEIALTFAGVKSASKACLVSLIADGRWQSFKASYLTPSRILGATLFHFHIEPRIIGFKGPWTLQASASYNMRFHSNRKISGFEEIPDVLQRDCLDRFGNAIANLGSYGISFRADRAIGRVAVGLSVGGSHNRYGNTLDASIILSL